MTVCQALTGRAAGLTALLTADRGVFIGTYFPKHGRPGLRGLLELIPRFRRSIAGAARRNAQRAMQLESLQPSRRMQNTPSSTASRHSG